MSSRHATTVKDRPDTEKKAAEDPASKTSTNFGTPSSILKRTRETGSSGKKPVKKRRTNERSRHLLVITKEGDKYVNISREEYQNLCNYLLDRIFDGSDLNGVEPWID